MLCMDRRRCRSRSVFAAGALLLALVVISVGNAAAAEERKENAARSRWDAARSWAMQKLKRGGGDGERVAVGEETKHAGAMPVERAVGFPEWRSRWDAVRSWSKKKMFGTKPEPEAARPKASGQGMGERVKEAIVKSVETSKDTVEAAARSAGDAVDEAVSKAKQTLKTNIPCRTKDEEL